MRLRPMKLVCASLLDFSLESFLANLDNDSRNIVRWTYQYYWTNYPQKIQKNRSYSLTSRVHSAILSVIPWKWNWILIKNSFLQKVFRHVNVPMHLHHFATDQSSFRTNNISVQLINDMKE